MTRLFNFIFLGSTRIQHPLIRFPGEGSDRTISAKELREAWVSHTLMTMHTPPAPNLRLLLGPIGRSWGGGQFSKKKRPKSIEPKISPIMGSKVRLWRETKGAMNGGDFMWQIYCLEARAERRPGPQRCWHTSLTRTQRSPRQPAHRQVSPVRVL